MSKIIKKYKYYILPIGLILVLSFSRLIPHPWNFTPILAAGIFAGSLELVKEGNLKIKQENLFDDIFIKEK